MKGPIKESRKKSSMRQERLGNQINEKSNQEQKITKQSFLNKKETSLVSGPHLSFVGLLQLDSLWARELGFFLAELTNSRTKVWQVRERRDELDVYPLCCSSTAYCHLTSQGMIQHSRLLANKIILSLNWQLSSDETESVKT